MLGLLTLSALPVPAAALAASTGAITAKLEPR